MASSLAAQLSQIAATSTHQLDLKAQRAAHSHSLIFDKKVAASQDFDTVFQICHEGFQELCALDSRFIPFQRTIFSDQSKAEDRGQMTQGQNQELDAVLESFLALVGGRLLLNPAVKALDWLIRRFRVHEKNTSFLILTFLPYHTTPLFLNLLSLLPDDITATFKFLYPYKRSLTPPPRHPIVHSASTNKPFFAALNDYVLQVSKAGCQYQGLVSFWAGMTTEALANMLDSARSGRLEIENRNKEDVLFRILPTLNDALSLKGSPHLTVGCFMVCVVLANKGSLSDNVLDTLMEAVVSAWTPETITAGFTCLSVLAQQKDSDSIPRRVVKSVSTLENSVAALEEVNGRYSVTRLVLQLVGGCASELKKKRQDASHLAFVYQVVDRRLLDDSATVQAMKVLLQTADACRSEDHLASGVRQQLSDTFMRLNESDTLGPLFQNAIQESGVDVSPLEMSLELVLAKGVTNSAPADDVPMIDAPPSASAEELFTKSLESLRHQSMKEESFLEHKVSAVFDHLSRLFIQTAGDEEKLSLFTNLPILKKDSAVRDPRYFSFFVRFFSGPYPSNSRATAIRTIMSSLHNIRQKNLDLQALLPYNIFALMDPSERVRSEAAELLAEIDSKCSGFKADDQDSVVWGQNQIYGREDAIQWMPSRTTHKVVRRALLPALEEYIFDFGHIRELLARVIRGSRDEMATGSKSAEAGLKKPVRHGLYSFLCAHAIATPLYSVKLRLLYILNQLGKVGSTSRTQALLPLLNQWQHLSSDDLKMIEDREHVPLGDIEEQILLIVNPKDHDAFDTLFSLAVAEQENRHSFVRAAFNRLRDIWPSFMEDQETSAAERLLKVSLNDTDTNGDFTTHCRGLLRSVDLSGAVLIRFIDKVLESAIDADYQAPARKKRRTSESNILVLDSRDPKELDRAVQRMAYILELVDGSKPEKHPELSRGLIKILGAIHQLKLRAQSEMGYLLSLILGILLSIVNKAKEKPAIKLDVSGIRVDLIIDCIRTSESPQVQNTALLLVAGLASIAPEIVLHSVMPIFTFMGTSVLRKDDAYSSLVIDQTIDQVVPPLIQSLRKQKRDVVSSTSELLLSFTAAFEHIPSYRRLRLYETLIDKLGTMDFLFAIFAVLANKYTKDKDVRGLMTSLASREDAEVQLTTYSRYLSLVRDTLQPKPTLSRTILEIGGDEGREPQSVATDLLEALSYLLKHASLSSKMSKYFESESEESSSKIHSLFSGILQQILELLDNVRSAEPLSKACGDTLGTFLGTLSLVDFFDTVEVLLGRPNDNIRRKVLRLTENRLDSTHTKDSASRTRALEFSSVLVDLLRNSPDILLNQAAVSCLEKISDKFGKKDPPKVVAAAKTVASDCCIGQPDDRIRVMGMLCLASMTEVLGEGVIPVLPSALPQSFDLLRNSLAAGEEKPSLHDAVYSFICALLVHVPWMVSGDHLDSILQLSFRSANADLPETCDENRLEALQLFAKRVNIKETATAIGRNWAYAVSEGSKAVNEALNVGKIAVDKHSKSSVIKNVSVLMDFLRNAFDLRRTQLPGQKGTALELDEIEEAEMLVNDVTIKMIYKLNDTIFRPLFIELTDWAINGVAKTDKTGRLARTTTFYRFLETFFGTLKSIVTGYSSYVLDNAVEVLNSVRCGDRDTQPLWLAVMRMLRNSFEHDQDEFWQSPTHLTAIASPLINQLSHSTNNSSLTQVSTELVPTIVELAAAADSPDNHKELNTNIMKFMRPGSTSTGSGSNGPRGDNPYTRLAAVRCQQSLTERLGEEWLALLPEMLPYISELMEDDNENVEKEVRNWVLAIEEVLGEKLDDMLV